MDTFERNMMIGMIDIISEAKVNSIITEEQLNARLLDLKEFENDTGIMFVNSPNCEIDLSSIISFKKDYVVNEECSDVEDIIKFSNKRPMVVYPNIIGDEITVLYIDGIISMVQVENALVNLSNVNNLPYNINKNGAYVVEGKIIRGDKPKFFVNCIIDENKDNMHKSLLDAESLNFDVVPHWIASNLNPKKLQESIDFVLEYIDEEELPCDGVAFRFNNIKDNSDIIVYKKN